MRFESPQILWLLLLLPGALTALFWWSWKKRQALLSQFIETRLLGSLLAGLSPARIKLRLACLVLAVAGVILALARPQWGFTWEEVKQRGLDIVVAVDTSKSMLATDIAPNRLARAKLAVQDLVKLARSDRLGLVAFAGTAYLQCPLTRDDAAFRQSLDMLDVNLIPQGGTAIGEAIQTALTAFKEEDNHKVLVLFTDGEDHDSQAFEIAQRAAAEGLKIFTIGIGTTDGEMLRVPSQAGALDYVRDEQGNAVKSRLNDTLLQQLAGASQGGFYLPLRGARAIETLYEKGLVPLPKAESGEKLVRRYHERFHWPLLAAIILLMIEVLLPERKRPRLQSPVPSPQSPAASGAAATLALAFALACPDLLAASPSSALRQYQNGQYKSAQKEFEDLAKRRKDDSRLHYNAGASAFRARDLDSAVKHFEQALGAEDLKLQEEAYYNRGSTLFQLGEANPDPKQRKETWQKSLQDFESSMKLNPQDADAKHNYEFVKRQLQELEQQQQQQQQDQQQNKDQNQEQQKQDSSQQKQDQQQNQQPQKQDQQQQNQQQQPQNQQQQQQQAKQDPSEKKDQPQGSDKDKQQQAAAAGKPQDDQKDQKEGQAQAAGQMTPEEARQLLDAQKGDEKMMPVKNADKPVDRARVFKDW